MPALAHPGTRPRLDPGRLHGRADIAVELRRRGSGHARHRPRPGRRPQALAWITNAFMLSFGSLLMAAGAGRRLRPQARVPGRSGSVRADVAGAGPGARHDLAGRAARRARAGRRLGGVDQAYPDQGRTRASACSAPASAWPGRRRCWPERCWTRWAGGRCSCRARWSARSRWRSPRPRCANRATLGGRSGLGGTLGFTAALALLTWASCKRPAAT